MDHNSSGRRPHYHRGRRGTDRRGNDRRTPQQSPDQGARPSGDQTDVEQIMRDIRSRISQRGIELSTQQIQDLAGRRLEAILDPRNINPTLLDQLRKGAAAQPDPLPRTADSEHSISDDAIYDGGAVLRFFRRLLNPLLKLLFNPAPLVAALQAQVKINRDAATRAVEHERRQTEWNALHYQVLQRLVTEVSRTSIEMQSLSLRVEALSARVDFNDRRVRALETAPAPAPSRSQRPQEVVPVPTPTPSPSAAIENAVAPVAPVSTPDGPRRKRRRRRGRRGSIPALGSGSVPAAATVETPDDGSDLDEGDDEEALEIPAVTEPTSESLSSGPAPSVEPEAEAPSEPQSPEPMTALYPEPVASPFPEPVAPAAPQDPMASEPAPVTPVPPPNPGTPEH